MSPTSRPATARQLRYLRALAQRTGQTFATPRSSIEASREIRRLKQTTSSGFTFAENTARDANDDVPLYSPAIRLKEIAGYGSSARWRHA